jgi:hypothetical protein
MYSTLCVCHSSGGQSPASHSSIPRSNLGQVSWDVWWRKWHGAGFLRVLLFPLPNIPLTAPHFHHPPSRVHTISQTVADIPSGLHSTPLQWTNITPQSCSSSGNMTSTQSVTSIRMWSEPCALRMFDNMTSLHHINIEASRLKRKKPFELVIR